MNIGIRLHDTAPGPLAGRAAAAAAQGFTCAHVALNKVMAAPPEPEDYTPAFARTLKAEISPLQIVVLGCYLNLAHPDEKIWSQSLARYLSCLGLASWVGGGCVVGTETGNPNAACRYDPALSHTVQARDLLIERLRPIVEAAEALQTVIAIEPAYTHIVYDPQTARTMLDAFASPCLKIILDPVNLLHADNIDIRDEVIADALDLLGPDIVAVHLKDYIIRGDALKTVTVGLGELNLHPVLKYLARRLPDVPVLLESTTPDTAVAARAHVENLLRA